MTLSQPPNPIPDNTLRFIDLAGYEVVGYGVPALLDWVLTPSGCAIYQVKTATSEQFVILREKYGIQETECKAA